MKEDILKEIAELKKQTQLKERLLELTEQYPDLHYVMNRWNKQMVVSNMIALEVDSVEISAMCGCCSDAAISAKRYKEIDGIRIYAAPVDYIIGHYDYSGHGVVNSLSRDNEAIRQYSEFPSVIQEKIRSYLAENPFELYEEDEDGNDD